MNLSLKHAQDFSIWLATEDKLLASPSERFELLEVWLAEQADLYSADTRNVTPRGWNFLDDLIAEGGTCSVHQVTLITSVSIVLRPCALR